MQDLGSLLANRQSTTADFVAELLIGRLRDFGITADSAEVQTLRMELAARQGELERALKPRVVVQKMAEAVAAAAVMGNSK